MQFVVPLVITAGVFRRPWRRLPQVAKDGSELWLQNAGFIWVPFIAPAAFSAWFGMNDIADAKASFAEQAVIFQRKHNWMMCWLYTGTFGSFIGFSAGFPLLTKTSFPTSTCCRSPSSARWSARCRARFDGLGRGQASAARASRSGCSSDDARHVGVIYFLAAKDSAWRVHRLLRLFMLLFFATGVGNASTFQMIPAIMRKEDAAR
jgi:NNP family nitrate/nitrite transporter-like MFS transporter